MREQPLNNEKRHPAHVDSGRQGGRVQRLLTPTGERVLLKHLSATVPGPPPYTGSKWLNHVMIPNAKCSMAT